MPHENPKRKKYDQGRIPWKRLGPREQAILDAGWAHVQSVPYKVSMRWLFYRLLQDGYYKSKRDYKDNAVKLFARARHTGQGEWRPDTLEDEGREYIIRSGGCRDREEAIGLMRQNVMDSAGVVYDHFVNQKNYVEVWYEAAAMTAQFEHYTQGVDLVPMAGSASIPFKWKIAKRLEAAAARYGKPIRVVYFGDDDPAGHMILGVVEKDVRRWCDIDFSVTWCGLTAEQAALYNVPESVEGKGFQWEALDDAAAGEIIISSVSRYIDLSIVNEAVDQSIAFSDEWQDKLEAALAPLQV